MSGAFYVFVLMFFIMAVPFPLWIYYAFLWCSAGLFYAICHFVLNVFGLVVVHPDSMNILRLFECMNLSIALYLCKFLFPEGKPCAFKKPIYVDPPFNFGVMQIVLYCRSFIFILDIS